MSKSQYGDRDTVGTLALKARECKDNPVAGDLGHELMPSLVEDLNEAIKSNPFHDKPFYITIHEKKDAQLNNMILRRVIKQEKRPYPEPSTCVFWTNPKSQETLFCWSLPHWSSFPNFINNPEKYNIEQLNDIYAYLLDRMDHFGFTKTKHKNEKGIHLVEPTPYFKDRKMGKERKIIRIIS